MLALMEIDEYLWAIRLTAKPIHRENVALRADHDYQVVAANVLEDFVQLGVARRVFSEQNDIRSVEAIAFAAELVAEIACLVCRPTPVTAVANVDDILVIAARTYLSKLAMQVDDLRAPCPFVEVVEVLGQMDSLDPIGQLYPHNHLVCGIGCIRAQVYPQVIAETVNQLGVGFQCFFRHEVFSPHAVVKPFRATERAHATVR